MICQKHAVNPELINININYIQYRFKTLNFYNKAYRFGGGVPANISKYKEAARMFKS